ncbi:MAG TPA: tyrosine--tRNA ligase [Candidatus Bathyarchaeia archaeon]|nr:tyrosine--tRNA ligase [Candidatus Bathyarchaeia archaeon]
MDKIDELLTRRVEKIYPSRQVLEKVLRSGKKLRLYQGFDPSRPNLHIGHLVGLLTMKQFQKLGHEVIFLIGDFTGMIGDPSGKLQARKALTKKQVLVNTKTYEEQAGMVLDFKGKNPVRLKFNSEWNSKLGFAEVLKLASHFTVPQLLERDMFQERLKKKEEIYLNEFLYPLIQGYDSVTMDIDLEIGGSDQMFNMLAGRKLVKELLGKEKFVLTTKLLVDSQGKKIGKTEGNAINIANPPEVLFGQIMSLADDCIIPCFELITEIPLIKVKEIEKSLKAGKNPMIYKKQLAFSIVKMLYGEKLAEKSQQYFEKVFQSKKTPEKIKILKTKVGKRDLPALLVELKMAPSKSEAKRLVKQAAVEINNKTIKEYDNITIKTGDIIKVGKKRWVKIKN